MKLILKWLYENLEEEEKEEIIYFFIEFFVSRVVFFSYVTLG